jgi:translocation and assembly module TamA
VNNNAVTARLLLCLALTPLAAGAVKPAPVISPASSAPAAVPVAPIVPVAPAAPVVPPALPATPAAASVALPAVSDPVSVAVSAAASSEASVNTSLATPELDEQALASATRPKTFALSGLDSDLTDLLVKNIPNFASNADPVTVTPPLRRKLRSDIAEILATEGYFSPRIRFPRLSQNVEDDVIVVQVDAGERAVVSKVTISFAGALQTLIDSGNKEAKEQRDSLMEKWELPEGEPFRQADWSRSKERVLDALRANKFAAASIRDSQVVIDAQTNKGELFIELDSGPVFIFGETQFAGLLRYPQWLLARFAPPKVGEPYSRSRLLDYQRALQNSSYFSTVTVAIDTDIDKASTAKVEVNVVERRSSDLGFGVGYSTNTGARTEISYRDRNLTNRAWDLRSALRIEQRRQVAYADLYLPPRAAGHIDSFGILGDRQDQSGLRITRAGLGAKRTSTHGSRLEQRLGLNLIGEESQLDGELAEYKKALVTSIGWTWREVDDNFAPRDGKILQLDLAGSLRGVISDQRFFRTSGKYQQWKPIGRRDSMIFRAEYGQVFANSEDGIPEDYLFRTGGSSTVRGYGYQSLGVQNPGGVTGGRVMAVASAEYVHWFKETWGGATFVDVGDAAANWKKFSAKQGAGFGVRYKTPAGPLALDLAYGRQTKRVRLEFSIAIAF